MTVIRKINRNNKIETRDNIKPFTIFIFVFTVSISYFLWLNKINYEVMRMSFYSFYSVLFVLILGDPELNKGRE